MRVINVKEMDTEINDGIIIKIADEKELDYVETILTTIADAAKVRGTGIARRSPEYIALKIKEGKAIIFIKSLHFKIVVNKQINRIFILGVMPKQKNG